MNSSDIRDRFISFFVKKLHKNIPSAPLVPENDPTTLFNSSGMQPLVPYLLGEPHPLGKRLVNSQKAVRTQDIDEVGDNRHTTYFEMLGNWSLGDYYKDQQIEFIWEFLTDKTNGLGLSKDILYVSVFEGNEDIPRDEVSIKKWISLGVQKSHIYEYGVDKNWWSRSGMPDEMPPGEPGGPSSEVFFEFESVPHDSRYGAECHPNCDCGRFMEIGNNVFMQYKKLPDGGLEELPNKNVDFGGGLERLTAATIDNPDIFRTDLFTSLIQTIETISEKKYGEEKLVTRAMRIVADHIKGGVMMLSDGVIPSNKLQGYTLRRMIRRSLLYGRNLGITSDWKYVGQLVAPIAEIYKDAYPEIKQKAPDITILLEEEAMRFGKSLEKGLREIEKVELLDGNTAFKLYETFGFPWEMTEEIARDRGQRVEKGEFESAFKAHQDKSRTAAKGMFKGGLADHSEQTVRLHTAHHLLLASLQKVIDPNIRQKGSNITAERLRIDFNLNRALTPEEKDGIEKLVNQKIQEDVPVKRYDMDRADAEKIGAQMEFGRKYPERVSVYFVDLKKGVDPKNAKPEDYFSAEFCGGPHVEHTGVIGQFKILKEEALGAGVRRVYATIK